MQWTRSIVRPMAGSVNLLLLLSALLSALTGGASAMRAPAAAHAAAAMTTAVHAEVQATRIASRPHQALPALAKLVALPQTTSGALSVVEREPLYASRRRE